ncbi:MAG: helix-turn-helix transcriptional regulator [Oscillospiraceae bacterium]
MSDDKKITENDIIQFLIDNSSEGHMVSAREIYAAMFKLKYGTDTVSDLSDNTVYNVYRMLDKLVEKARNSGNSIFYYGLKLHEEPCPDISRKDAKDVRKYYVEGPLSEAQIKILRDAIAVYSFADPKVTKDIIYGLNQLTPEYNQEPYNPQKVTAIKYNGTYYENIEEISKALSTTKYINELTRSDKDAIRRDNDRSLEKPVNTIRFKYCEYNSKKELVIKHPKFSCDENDPDVREVNPVKLMWTNGYYYLVTYSFSQRNGPVYVNYRVDRMTDVRCTDNKAELPPDKFNEVTYKNKNPVMYSDDKKYSVSMICSKSLINNVIDTFGFDVLINDIDASRVRVDIMNTSLTGVKMWALEYGFGCEILSPMSLRTEMKEAAEKLLKTYAREPTSL